MPQSLGRVGHKILNPSPTTAKEHIKRQKKGVRSTQIKVKIKGDINIPIVPAPVPQVAPPLLPLFVEPWPYPGPAYGARTDATLIPNDELIANVFCFRAFANKISGFVYNDLTGNFPFMSIYGSICFFILYHYKTNKILIKQIANLDDCSIFEAYKEVFESLEAKGYNPKLNVMDNQATKYIKQFLTKKKECNLQVVESHNHRINAAEHAIQMFKDAFIAALATADFEFLLQFWDKLAPQVQDTLNLLRTSQINPNILAYEALNGPYNWDYYPLAPPGCKAVIYKALAICGSWALRGTDAWYLGPAADHY
jgi:hypothetical protein